MNEKEKQEKLKELERKNQERNQKDFQEVLKMAQERDKKENGGKGTLKLKGEEGEKKLPGEGLPSIIEKVEVFQEEEIEKQQEELYKKYSSKAAFSKKWEWPGQVLGVMQNKQVGIAAVILLMAVSSLVLFLNWEAKADVPGKFYLKTLGGYFFSEQEGIDLRFRARYKPVTPKVEKEYKEYLKTGQISWPVIASVTSTEPAEWFDQATGEALLWYVERPEEGIVVSPLPGYDRKSGELFRPIIKEIQGDWKFIEDYSRLPERNSIMNKDDKGVDIHLFNVQKVIIEECNADILHMDRLDAKNVNIEVER